MIKKKPWIRDLFVALVVSLSVGLWSGCLSSGQGSAGSRHEQIRWLSFEQLSDTLSGNTDTETGHSDKKVLISFHTDWCAYCRKMYRQVYSRADIAATINRDFYAVRFDAESTDTVRFDGQSFVNKAHSTRRKGIHELAQILGSRGDRFSVPVTIILDADFEVQARYFEYLSPEKMRSILLNTVN